MSLAHDYTQIDTMADSAQQHSQQVDNQQEQVLREHAQELASKIIDNALETAELVRTYPYAETVKWLVESINERIETKKNEGAEKYQEAKAFAIQMLGLIKNYPYLEKISAIAAKLKNIDYKEKAQEQLLFARFFLESFLEQIQARQQLN